MTRAQPWFLALCVLATASARLQAQGDTVEDLVKAASAAATAGKVDDAIKLISRAAELDPKNAQIYFFRGSLYSSKGKNQEALGDFSKVITLDPKVAEAYQQRGLVQFKLGKINESIADFDKFLEFQPNRAAEHWQRGISYYYAGKFTEGMKQFEGYQTVDSNDVENAVWRFLCQARRDGVDKARKDMLKIGKDKRVPMTEVYEMFMARLKPEDVVKAAEADHPPKALLQRQLFYAHLYLGLYFDATGDKKKALEHMTRAADDYRIGHYMWDVARVHRDLLKKESK